MADPWVVGDPPEWLGDVSVGVDAWTQRAAPAGTPTPAGSAGSTEPGQERSGGKRRAPRRAPGQTSGDTSAEHTSRSGSRRRTGSTPGTVRFDSPAEEPVDEVTRGPEADPESVARTILLDQLTGQARSRKELADKLAKKLVPEEIATRLLDRFEEVGLVDDAAFARSWVDSRQSGKGLARRALAQELRRKGIADEVAREVLDEVDPADEEAAARALVAKKLRTMSRLDATTKTRRLVGMLARKGYGAGLAMTVVREAVRVDEDEMPESLP